MLTRFETFGGSARRPTKPNVRQSRPIAAVHVVAVGNLSALVHGVEGLEVKELHALTSELGVGEGADNAGVDGVLVLGTRAVGGEEADTLDVPVRVALDVVLVDGELVGGKGTSLVRAEDGNTGKLLNGGDTSDD
ncbi:MAG: hypothetical protein ACK5IM_07060, partial [Demequina sp.]|uniref:hypothetical protein n=1 Tax=Demequina sp. TaxID=2050685 RepID=UPI003A8BF7F9